VSKKKEMEKKEAGLQKKAINPWANSSSIPSLPLRLALEHKKRKERNINLAGRNAGKGPSQEKGL